MNATDSVRCSDVLVEPLPGSAKQESAYVIYEHPFGWSRDVLDGDTFGAELTAALKEKLGNTAGLQLIRQPGREGRRVDRPHLFVVHAASGACEMLRVEGPEAILGLDLSTPGANGGEMISQPLILVCTHGKRDVCCAVKGRPLAAALSMSADDPLLVWETSHTKGHRFAPSLLLMPWGYSFGRLNESAATQLLDYALAGRYFLPGNRGRGLYGPRGQVAELAVAEMLIRAGESLNFGDLSADDTTVDHIDGRHWRVELRQEEAHGIVASCGAEPKNDSVWVAVSIVPCHRL